MTNATLEHTNITVSNPTKTAETLCNIFDWKIRWQGSSMDSGYTVHVGTKNSYLALYTNEETQEPVKSNHSLLRNLNHIGIQVDDITSAEQKVKNAGFRPHNHGDYEPGTRFYFHCEDNLEVEVISYSQQTKLQMSSIESMISSK